MKSRIYARKKTTREQTLEFSTAPAQPMFQSRPFVVQTQQAEPSQQQKDLKTELRRAARFGYSIRKRPTEMPTFPPLLQRTIGDGIPERRKEDIGVDPQESGSSQGEHIFNALGNLGKEMAQMMRTMINDAAEKEQKKQANDAINSLETRATALIAARDNSQFRAAPPGVGDRVNASKYSSFVQTTRDAVEKLIGGAASEQSVAWRRLTVSREIVEKNTIDQVAVAAKRKSYAGNSKTLNSFNAWYEETRNLMYEVYKLIHEAASLVARTRAGLPPMEEKEKEQEADQKRKRTGREYAGPAWHKQNTKYL